jgi:4a-hydroxytetrahydrobiopterin dehydratase
MLDLAAARGSAAPSGEGSGRMDTLTSQHASALRKGEAALTDAEIDELRQQVPGWLVAEGAGVPKLEKGYTFDDFRDALAFTNRVGQLAEQEGHHPVIVTEWGHVTVSWWTHAVKGLHRNDFIMAAKTDELAESRPTPPA